jgi:uncharacterized protein YbbC (DUF1343 family)
MTKSGLQLLIEHFPDALKKKRLGILSHAASIDTNYTQTIDVLGNHPDVTLGAIFGPQHGLFGQTQDNMIEWQGYTHPVWKVPVYSLYSETRLPTPEMLKNIDVLVVDIQDVGARPYTYIWTVKHCMEACAEKGIPVWILDRPNPIAAIPADGGLLDSDYFSFVGGASIPLCHRMTLGEMAVFVRDAYVPTCTLEIVWMKDWSRDMLFADTGLPWILPSPNMPTLDTAIVYPGMVLLEATNCSEGRGTTRPFELFGAPYIQPAKFLKRIADYNLSGVIFREHGFIPTFQKWAGIYCNGFQLHVTDYSCFESVFTTAAIFAAIIETSDKGFLFKDPPYEYEKDKMPFDILAGNPMLRLALQEKSDLTALRTRWRDERADFEKQFVSFDRYPLEKRC